MSGLTPERQKTFEAFYQGATDKNVEQMKSALTDDFTFTGPMMQFDNPDDFVKSLLNFDGKVTQSRMIVDGDHMVHTYVLDIGVQIPMCDVVTFNGAQMASMELYTDSKLFDPANAH